MTIAVERMLLTGVSYRHAKLQQLLAHSVGTLQFLIGRPESYIAHDAYLCASLSMPVVWSESFLVGAPLFSLLFFTVLMHASSH